MGSSTLSKVTSIVMPSVSMPLRSQYWATKAPMQLPSEATKSCGGCGPRSVPPIVSGTSIVNLCLPMAVSKSILPLY